MTGTKLSFVKLNSVNYDEWVVAAKAYLITHKIWKQFKISAATKPVVDEKGKTENKKIIDLEEENFEEAMASLILLLEPSEFQHVKGMELPKDAWEALETRYVETVSERPVALLRKLVRKMLSPGERVSQHIDTMVSWNDKLKKLDKAIPDMSSLILTSLDNVEYFNTIVTQLEHADSKLTVQRLTQVLVQEEFKHIEVKAGEVYFIKEKRNERDESGRRQVNSNIICYWCSKKGHPESKCFSKKNGKPKTEQSNEVVNTVVNKVSTIDAYPLDSFFILDGGSTCHVVNNRRMLTDFVEFQDKYLMVANGEKVRINGKGVLAISLDNGHGWQQWRFTDVCLVEDFPSCILSESRLQKKGLKIIGEGKLKIVYREDQQVMYALQINGQFRVTWNIVDHVLSVAPCHDVMLWHRRYGHPSLETTIKIMEENGLKVNKSTKLDCEICLTTKTKQKNFNRTPTRRNLEFLDLVVKDLSGPIKPTTINGEMYLDLTVDVATKFVFGELLVHKSDATRKYIAWSKKMVVSEDKVIKHLRTDGGGEFKNDQMKTYLESQGTTHQFSIPYTSQQNGIAERMNGTIWSKIRSILKDSKLLFKYWGFAAMFAIFLHNITPGGEDKVSPYKRRYGKPYQPAIEHIFGEICFALTPGNWKAVERRKILDRGIKCVFLGFAQSFKGDIVMELESGRVFVSRSVSFLSSPKFVDTQEQLDASSNLFENENLEVFETPEKEFDLPAMENEGSNTSEVGETTDPFSGGKDVIPILYLHTRTSKIPVATSKHTRSGKTYGIEEVEIADPTITQMHNLQPIEKTPEFFHEAMKQPDADLWMEAIQTELDSLLENETWEEVASLPEGRKEVGSRWVFALKRDGNGSIIKYKARLVAQGFSQVHGIDFNETFSAVARYETVRFFLSLVASLGLILEQADIVTAYLAASLKEEIYLRPPPGIAELKDKKLKLKKCLYGLKQSGREWNHLAVKALEDVGFSKCHADESIFIWREEKEICMVLLYVDDFAMAGSKQSMVDTVKETLSLRFKTKLMGPLKHFLNIRVERDGKYIWIDREAKIDEFIIKHKMENCKMYDMPSNERLSDREEETLLDADGTTKYMQLVAGLNYLAQVTRPDIAFAVNQCCRFMSKPKSSHLTALKRIIGYLRKTKSLKLRLGGDMEMKCFVDADWNGCVETSRSSSGYVVMFGGAVVWSAIRQKRVSLSSMESELMALTHSVQGVIWCRRLLQDLGFTKDTPTRILEDNQSVLDTMKQKRFHGRAKHIDHKFYFVRDEIDNQTLTLEHVQGTENTADIFTKPLNGTTLKKFCLALNLGRRRSVESVDTIE